MSDRTWSAVDAYIEDRLVAEDAALSKAPLSSRFAFEENAFRVRSACLY